MQQDLFESRYQDQWIQFDQWLNVASGGSTKNATARFPTSELPERYRQLARHLALARDRQYGAALISRLERLVLAGHQTLYGAGHTRRGGVALFIRQTFPKLIRTHWQSVLVAFLCLFGPLVGLAVAIQFTPDIVYIFMSSSDLANVQQMYDPANRKLGAGRDAASDVQMWGMYVWNNVRIGFQCFAGGLLFGVGAIFFMIFNGVHIGVVTGHLTQLGFIETFWGFVAGHSALELGGIVLCGAAGLQLGYALIAPGRKTRLEALKASTPDAVGILYGAATMIFLAAFIEGFWSASRIPPVEVKYTVGILLWLLMLSYFVFAGRGIHQVNRDAVHAS